MVTTTKSAVKTAPKKETVAKAPVRAQRTFEPTDMIPCRSVTGGELLFPAKKTDMVYRWTNYGDITEVEYQDLRALKSMKSNYLFKPYFVIEDEDLVEEWAKDLAPIYADLEIVDDISLLFLLPNDVFKERVETAPEGIQNTIKVFAAEKIQNGELDSIKKIEILDEVLHTDLKLYI